MAQDRVKVADAVPGRAVDVAWDEVEAMAVDKAVGEAWGAVVGLLAPPVNVPVPTAARLSHINKGYLVLR